MGNIILMANSQEGAGIGGAGRQRAAEIGRKICEKKEEQQQNKKKWTSGVSHPASHGERRKDIQKFKTSNSHDYRHESPLLVTGTSLLKDVGKVVIFQCLSRRQIPKLSLDTEGGLGVGW